MEASYRACMGALQSSSTESAQIVMRAHPGEIRRTLAATLARDDFTLRRLVKSCQRMFQIQSADAFHFRKTP